MAITETHSCRWKCDRCGRDGGETDTIHRGPTAWGRIRVGSFHPHNEDQSEPFDLCAECMHILTRWLDEFRRTRSGTG